MSRLTAFLILVGGMGVLYFEPALRLLRFARDSDVYTYIPAIGLYLMVAFGAAEFVRRDRRCAGERAHA